MAFSKSTSPESIWGLGGPEEDRQLNHCCWTGRVSDREEEEEEEEEEEDLILFRAATPLTSCFCLCWNN